MRNNKGFSLVELIVVIAIMAVLASVAVIGVSVYIPKAQQASDDQLIADINYIFKTACLDAGVELSDVNAAVWNSAKDSWGLTSVNGQADHEVAKSFRELYSVKNPELKYYGYVEYENGAFVGKGRVGETPTPAGTQTYTHNNKEYIVADKDRDALMGSIFADPNVMTPGDLVTNVDAVVDFAAERVDTNELLANLVTVDAFKEIFKSMYDKDVSEGTEQEKMSALVVYTAQNSQDLNNQDVYDSIIVNGGGYGYIAGTSDDTQDVATMAMHYALGMAWAKQNNINYNDDPAKLFELMSKQEDVLDEDDLPTGEKLDSEFVQWLKTENGKATAMDAMDGYKGAMNIIGGNSDKIQGDELYDENGDYAGFGSYEDLIKDVMGQKS